MSDSMLSLVDAARLSLACLDLTSLNDADTPADVELLCRRAQTPFGPVAAVCVWPRFAALARSLLPVNIRVAAVANFPAGEIDLAGALDDVAQIRAAGAQEVDVVLPYRALLAGRDAEVLAFLKSVREACAGLTLKVIIESGELKSPEAIARASALALQAGADFIKTSTGKTPVSATPEAANAMLDAIAQSGRSDAGFKASGGIRSVQDAQTYLGLAAERWGMDALKPERFRFGASGLLNDIEAVLAGQASTSQGGSY